MGPERHPTIYESIDPQRITAAFIALANRPRWIDVPGGCIEWKRGEPYPMQAVMRAHQVGLRKLQEEMRDA